MPNATSCLAFNFALPARPSSPPTTPMAAATTETTTLLPIDIHYNKLLYWLVDRRAIPAKWALHLSTARTLTRAALAATPAPLHQALRIPVLTAHQNLPYFTIRSYLRQLTSDPPPNLDAACLPPTDKDMLGRYKSPVLRAWAAAVSAFENGAVYLADAAQHMTHNTNNEAAAIKANIARLNKNLADFARREAQLIRSAAESAQRFEQTLKQYQLHDDGLCDFHAQLMEHVERELPLVLQSAVQRTRSERFQSCVNYYRAFSSYVSRSGHADVCAAIHTVMHHDMKALTAPLKHQSPSITVEWGDMPSVEHTSSSAQPDDSAQASIDWGIEIGETGTASHIDEHALEQHIENKVVAVQSASPQPAVIDWSAAMGELNGQSERSTHADELSEQQQVTLCDAQFREKYLNDLIELQAFLAQRRTELNRIANSDMAMALQQSSLASTEINSVDVDAVDDMCATVDDAVEAINSAETRKLVALQSSEKLLERTAKGVLEKKHTAERTRGAIDVLRAQRTAAAVELKEEMASMERVAEQTRRIKKETEEALSKLYNGRVVNIVGDINILFAPKRT
eukprot:TRINITY_DN91_c0_g1_i1.p2 TRINITY_DN91_c0_g1~~TRINITY_DN91_c0_g1_i1.p2  ORF type:complete len:570 (-),score=129.28 TRINITY_DN91_c0_g1_i1:5599-7308(-)